MLTFFDISNFWSNLFSKIVPNFCWLTTYVYLQNMKHFFEYFYFWILNSKICVCHLFFFLQDLIKFLSFFVLGRWSSQTRTTDAQWSLFSLKSRAFGLGQTNWADKFWGIWGIFSWTISTHFGTVSPLSMFFVILL